MNTVESKSAVKNSVLRVMIAAVLIIIQVFLIVKLAIYLSKYYAAFDIIMSLIAFLCVLRIYGRPDNSAFKLSWLPGVAFSPERLQGKTASAAPVSCGNSGTVDGLPA